MIIFTQTYRSSFIVKGVEYMYTVISDGCIVVSECLLARLIIDGRKW